MITADFHTHTNFSTDSKSTMDSMIDSAISHGLSRICITDHMDKFYPVKEYPFIFDPDMYFIKLKEVKEKYKADINVLFGIELGLRNEADIKHEVKNYYDNLLSSYPFDFVIGSTHVLEHIDPYYAIFWENKTIQQGIYEYFSSIKENASFYTGIQVYGHMDYIIRYLPYDNKEYSFLEYEPIIKEALQTLIDHGIGIEANCSGYKYGLGVPHPKPEILKLYKELGGEIITIASDAHKPEHIAYDFKIAEELLLNLGYRYYTVFEDKKPIFLKF